MYTRFVHFTACILYLHKVLQKLHIKDNFNLVKYIYMQRKKNVKYIKIVKVADSGIANYLCIVF